MGSVGATTAGLLFGCGASPDGPAAAGTTSAQVASADSQHADGAIVERLSSARCDQEQGCNNIGAGQKFATRGVCMDQVRGSIGNELNAYKCPRGIEQAQVERCLNAVKSEECSHPFQTLSRYDACRGGGMCMN
jgi:hypothetical protein